MRTLIGLSMLLAVTTGLFAYGPRVRAAAAEPVPVLVEPDPRAPIPPAPEPSPAAAPEPSPAAAPEPARASAPPPVRALPELEYVGGPLRGSLQGTLSRQLPSEVADPLTQVVKRVVVWWLDPRRDLRAEDRVQVLYEPAGDAAPIVHAVVYESAKDAHTYRAYAFRRPGDRWTRLYDAEGVEIEARLVDGPVRDYEQVTSLLSDGRGHQGVDFKTPIGTEVFAPFDGVVSRRNWSTRRNGNCLHLRGPGGVDALFLHLSEVLPDIQPGTRVKKGQPIARSGNTGRSTAPHLHYQLQRGRRVVDPFRHHDTHRARLSGTDLQLFHDLRSRLEARLEEGRT